MIEEVLKLKEILFPRPGQYRFRLMEGGQPLPGGEAYLRVMLGDDL